MPAPQKTNGDYFANKAEAIAYYRDHEENLKDKPEWLIECMIDFAIQYPNYKEYCEVEAKVKAGQELNAKQKKKYGNLDWEKKMTDYKDGEVLTGKVDIQQEGEYGDIIRDREEFEKINKYGLTYNDEFETKGDPSAPVTIQFKGPEDEVVTAVADGKGACTVMLKDADEESSKSLLN